MDPVMLASFLDELQKIGAANVAAADAVYKGQNISAKPASSGTAIPKSTPKDPTAKSTNYSIVHSQTPPAAYGTAASTSKAVPPPPVRT